jgi:hypothetical protein
MNDRVLRFADQLLGCSTQHLRSSRIDERREPLAVEPIDAFTGASENGLVSALEFLDGTR